MEIPFCANFYRGKPIASYPKARCQHSARKFVFISCRAANSDSSNFYELLNLSPSSVGTEEIKKAYRKKALEYHPDVCRSSVKEDSTKLFLKLHQAYKVLSDPVLREQYDYKLTLSNSTRNYNTEMIDDQVASTRWDEQIYELERRTSCRAVSKVGSWGSRMRARNME